MVEFLNESSFVRNIFFCLETVFDTVNQEIDKIEQKRRAKFKQNNIYDDEKTSDLILQGQLKKNTGTFGFSWQIRYTKLYPNRLELHYEKGDKDPEVNQSFALQATPLCDTLKHV